MIWPPDRARIKLVLSGRPMVGSRGKGAEAMGPVAGAFFGHVVLSNEGEEAALPPSIVYGHQPVVVVTQGLLLSCLRT